jgi:hypothetical protein
MKALLALRTLALAGATNLAFAPDIPERLERLPRTPIDYDRALLDAREARVLPELFEASRSIGEIFLRQVSEKNPALRRRLTSEAAHGVPGAADALSLFRVNAGPWDRLAGDAPFIGNSPKPPGAGFYPADLTKEEFERWTAAHPGDRKAFEGLFTVIRRDGRSLAAIPYSRQYRNFLEPVAGHLRRAAAMTGSASLRAYLEKRADALLSDDYFASDLAWMDLDSDIEVTIGPYEVYEDGLFNYKASYQSFVTVRDKAESEKLAAYARHLPEMERPSPSPINTRTRRANSNPRSAWSRRFTPRATHAPGCRRAPSTFPTTSASARRRARRRSS